MAKKLVMHKFFSTELLPKSIADQGEKAVEEFENRDRKANLFHFKEGDEVVHKYNIKQQMIVQEIRKKREIVRGQERIRLDGIICHWWIDNESA